MPENKIIIIGGDHYNALGILRSLGVAGFCSYLIVVTSNKNSFIARSKYVKKSWLIKKEAEILTILRHEFVLEKRPPIIICASDASAELIDRNYSWLSRKYLLFNSAHREGQISYWMNKSRMVKIAEKAGFIIPRSWEINLKDSQDISGLILEDMIYPCIIKPQKSCDGSKYDFRICHNRVDLAEALSELKKHLSFVLVQEYLKPDYEISFPAVRLSKSGENIIPGLIIKLETCRNTFNLGMVAFACLKPQLQPLIDVSVVTKFMTLINYSGLYSMDFFVHNNQTYFLEVNLRSDGNTFYATNGGVNLPLLWIIDITGHDTTLLKKRIDYDVYGMLEISYLKYLKWSKFFQGIKDWYRSDCFSIFSWKDIKPFFFKFIYFFKN